MVETIAGRISESMAFEPLAWALLGLDQTRPMWVMISSTILMPMNGTMMPPRP